MMKEPAMTRSIFSLFLAVTLLSMPVIAAARDGEGDSSGRSSIAQAADTIDHDSSIATEIKTERTARKKALDDYKAAQTAQKLTKSQELATKLINERLKTIALLGTNGVTKKCRPEAKAEVDAALAAVQTELKAEQTQISTLTTVDAVKTLIQSNIVGKNYVYVVVLPAVRGMCVADKIIGLIDGKLTTASTKLKAQGLDTTEFDKDLSDAKIAAQNAYNTYKKVANAPGATTVKTDLATAKASLKVAKEDLAKARTALAALAPDDSTETPETTTPSN